MDFFDFWWQIALGSLIIYLISNTNFAILFANKFFHQDIRKLGSGNPGTTNIVRNFGIKIGAITFLCDVAKGLLAGLLGLYALPAILNCQELAFEIACVFGLAAILGHIYPVLLKFNGGKGVATSIGFFLAINPLVLLCSFVVAIIIILICDKVSAFAIFHITLECVWCIVKAFVSNFSTTSSVIITVCMAIIWFVIIIEHRANIARLINGTENDSGIRKAIFKK